ncbi:MAG: hypothetical protein IPH49_14795 [Ignavibacteria bacterium]|nr:hypothetical protein [Ignavibacteria bacterium]
MLFGVASNITEALCGNGDAEARREWSAGSLMRRSPRGVGPISEYRWECDGPTALAAYERISDPLFVAPWVDTIRNNSHTRVLRIEVMRGWQALFAPGKGWGYSNMNYVIARTWSLSAHQENISQRSYASPYYRRWD